MDLNVMIAEGVGSYGLGVVVMLLVQLGKKVGLVKDGTASSWATGINVVVFSALALGSGVFGVDLEGETTQQVLQVLILLAQIGIGSLGSVKTYGSLRDSSVKGFRAKI